MTRDKKIGRAYAYCEEQTACRGCPCSTLIDAKHDNCDFDEFSEEDIDECLKIFEDAKLMKMSNADFAVEVAERIAQRELNAETDNVNHPQHYELPGGIECIDVLLATQGKESVQAFCLCNAIKYLYRHKRKNGIEDIRKARWYIEKYLELEGRNDAQARE